MESLKYGATMYMPSLRTDLIEAGNGLKYKNLRTVVFCTEDSTDEKDLPLALGNIHNCLGKLADGGIFRFIRPRNPGVLQILLKMPNINKITGFVLPKADLGNLPAYFEVLGTHENFEIMPTIETKIAFDLPQLYRLRDYLAASPLMGRITALRIGALDLLNILSLRRNVSRSIYLSPIGHIIDQLITVFRPSGLELAAPGYEGLKPNKVLGDELTLDISRGLFAKTAIHPDQIDIIHQAYQVDATDLEMAEAIMDPSRPPIFKLGSRMCEKAVHVNWAVTVYQRARLFGVRPESALRQPAELKAEPDQTIKVL
jgi:citrate lyase beta subunit